MRTMFKHASSVPSGKTAPAFVIVLLVLSGIVLGVLGMHAPAAGHGLMAEQGSMSVPAAPRAISAVSISVSSDEGTTPVLVSGSGTASGGHSLDCPPPCTGVAMARGCVPELNVEAPHPVLPAIAPAGKLALTGDRLPLPCVLTAGEPRRHAPSLVQLSISRT